MMAGQRQRRAGVEGRPLLARHMTVRAGRRPVDQIAPALDDRRLGARSNRRVRGVEAARPPPLDGEEAYARDDHEGEQNPQGQPTDQPCNAHHVSLPYRAIARMRYNTVRGEWHARTTRPDPVARARPDGPATIDRQA